MSALAPGQVLQVPVGKLLPDPNQPRKTFMVGALRVLIEALEGREK